MTKKRRGRITVDTSGRRHCIICGLPYVDRRGIECFGYYNTGRHKWSNPPTNRGRG